MRFFAKLTVISLALVALAGFTASSAFATGSLTGVVSGDSDFADPFTCDIAVEYSGTVANNDVGLPTGAGSVTSTACPTLELDSNPGVNINTTPTPDQLTFNSDLEFSVEVGDPPFAFRCDIQVDNAALLFLSDGTAGDGPEYGEYDLQNTPVEGDACIGGAQVDTARFTFDDD